VPLSIFLIINPALACNLLIQCGFACAVCWASVRSRGALLTQVARANCWRCVERCVRHPVLRYRVITTLRWVRVRFLELIASRMRDKIFRFRNNSLAGSAGVPLVLQTKCGNGRVNILRTGARGCGGSVHGLF
jgi:hypothetical protein